MSDKEEIAKAFWIPLFTNAKGAEQDKLSKMLAQLPEIKCINCGYRVLKKVRPQVVKKVESV